MKRSRKLESGFSLVELVFVMLISGILASIAIPKLEMPIKNGYKIIKEYTKTNLKAGNKGQATSQQYKLINTKLLIRSYILSAKSFYLDNGNLAKTAKDLSVFQEVRGCSIPKSTSFQWKCIYLDKKLNTNIWSTLNGDFIVRVISIKPNTFILATPYTKQGKGVSACYNSEESISVVKIIEANSGKVPIIKC